MTTQAVLVSRSKLNPNHTPQQLALFMEDGTPFDAEAPVGNATTTTKGVVNQMPAQTNSAAADIAAMNTNFNALLAKLRTAGLMVP
jgi:hypothetical protein